MFYRIDKNYLNGPLVTQTVRSVGDARLAGDALRFRLVDAEGVPCFAGVGDEPGAKAALEWAVRNSPAISLQVLEGGEWTTLNL